jgi:hypothetical protein
MSGSKALPSDVTSVTANMNGMKIISRIGVMRGRKPLRSIMIPRAIPPTPMISMAPMPSMNIWSIHGVK